MTTSQSLFARSLFLALGPLAVPLAGFANHDDDSAGTVYTMSNAADGNRILVFDRHAGGGLKWAASYPTGGMGTGASLGDQGALALSGDGRWLLAVNAASNELSVFAVHRGVLVLTDIVPSGGENPISVAIDANLVYVLHAGGAVGSSDNISGFYLSPLGRLQALPGSTQALSAANTGPAQISFGLHGDQLVVTEKNTNLLDQFAVDTNGVAGPVHSSASSGATPFGFAVSRSGLLVVSEAPGSALSSYWLHPDATLNVVTASLGDNQGAACWVVLSKNERYAYTANAASSNISGYRIAPDGSLTLFADGGVTGVVDNHPLDMGVTEDGRFLYSLNTGSQTIVGFRIGANGSLTRVSDTSGVPASAAGLVAR
ncbi:MAG TPA: beta-propeller fold lactonase family protein [Opitutaceae bacterium]|nr:beta-propeller fold lactonase family protein [Opitutaceae bacterium]